jgi:integrase
MATEKLVITDREIRRAKEMAEAGKTPDGKPYIFTDEKFTGLRLFVQAKKASWVVRWKDNSVTIGYVHPVGDRTITAPKSVRDLAATVMGILKDDPEKARPFLDAHWSGQSKSAALQAVHKTADTWTLRECVEATISGKTAHDAKHPITENTVKDYRSTFGRECFQKILDKPAVLLTRGDIEGVRDYVKKHSGASPAIKVVTYTRAVLTYCARNHAGQSGLEKVGSWWNELNAPYQIKARDRRPEVKSIVKSMLLAEEYLTKPLPGRAHGVNGTNPGTLAGLWWLVLTCQRAEAGMSLLAHDIVDDPQADDFKIAVWSKDVMKAGQAHALPIPSRAWDLIDGFREKGRYAGSQEWAFPSEKKKGVHATPSGVYRILYRLAGRDALIQEATAVRKGKKVPERTERRDLLAEAGIDWWSLHDLRRSITKALDEHGIPGGATVILAHDIHEKEALAVTASERERDDFHRLRTARITKMAYGGSQYLKLKKEAMQIWCDTVLDEYERQKAEKEMKNAA